MLKQTGQCLCGGVKYAVTGEPVYNVVCHCKNCKRQTGSALLTAGIYPKEQFELLAFETVKRYADGATDSSTPLIRCFCGECGSSVYATTELVPGIVSIFAGTLDDYALYTPSKEQFVDSRATWFPELGEYIMSRMHRGPSGPGVK